MFLDGAVDGAHHESSDPLVVAESHLGLGGMDVQIHREGGYLQEKRHHGIPVGCKNTLIGALHRAQQKAVPDGTAIDEQELSLGIGPVECRQAGESGDEDPVTLRIDRNRILPEIASQDSAQAGEPGVPVIACLGAAGETSPCVELERHRDALAGHGETLHHIGHGRIFCAFGLEELQTRRCCKEKIRDLDGRSRIPGSRADRADAARLDRDHEATVVRPLARDDPQSRHGTDRRQCFSPEAQRSNFREIVVGQFGRRVAFDREGEIGGVHAGAVVRNRNRTPATAVDVDLDARGTCINGILDQFLDDRGWPLDHLTGGNAVDRCLTEAPDHAHYIPALKISLARLLPSSTAGWLNGSIPVMYATRIVSIMK